MVIDTLSITSAGPPCIGSLGVIASTNSIPLITLPNTEWQDSPGIEQSLAKKIIENVKNLKIKVQIKINGNELRVTGKKKDDLQSVIEMVKDSKIGIPVQFVNYRD